MALTSFGKILTVLDLFSVTRHAIDVDIISHELELSRPTSYRYLKELVSTGLLQRINGTSGEYILGPKVAVLDYFSRATDPLVQISMPYMKEIAERTELNCILTFLNHDYCIDLHSEPFKENVLISYGRGNPRPVYIGASPKIILAHTNKHYLEDFYRHYSHQLKDVNFVASESAFLDKMKKIKKQGYYFSQGEVLADYSGLAVPVRYSNKIQPLALTIVGTKNRFEYIDLQKMISTLQDYAMEIEFHYKNPSLAQ